MTYVKWKEGIPDVKRQKNYIPAVERKNYTRDRKENHICEVNRRNY
jgi:hypothetical protein